MKVISQSDLPKGSYGILQSEKLIVSSPTVYVGPPDQIGTLFLFSKHLVFALTTAVGDGFSIPSSSITIVRFHSITESRQGFFILAKDKNYVFQPFHDLQLFIEHLVNVPSATPPPISLLSPQQLPHLPPSVSDPSLLDSQSIYRQDSAQSPSPPKTPTSNQAAKPTLQPSGSGLLSISDFPMMNTTQPTPTTPTLRQRIPYIVRRYSTPTKEEQSQVDSPASTTSESLPRSQDKTPKSNPQIFSEPQPSSDQLLWPSHSPHTFEIPKEPTSPLPKERVGSTSPSLHPLMPNLLKKEKKKQAQILKRSPTSQSQILASPTISPTTIIESPEYPSPQPSLRGLETAQNQTTDQVSQAHSIPLPSVISPSGKVRLHLPPRHSILHIPFLAYLPRPPSHPPPKPDEPILRPLTTPYFHHIIPNLTLIQFLLNAIHYSSFIHFIFFRSSASAFPKAEETNAIPPFFLTTSERDAFIPIEPQENVQPSSALSPVESTPIVAQEDPITLINGLLDSPLSVGGTNQQFDWVPFTPDPPSTTLASFKRVINYVAPTNANIGPPSTHTRETHELHHFSPTHSVYTIRLDCLDVPYASHFYYFQKLVLKEEEYDPAHLEIENPVGAFDKDADAIMTEKANQNMPYLLPEVKKSLRIHATFDVVIVKPFIIQAMFTKISTQKSVIIDTELANFFRKVSLRRNTSRLLDWKRIVAENTTPEEIQSILNVEQASIFSDVSAVASSGGETHKSEQGPKTTSSSLSTFPPPSPVPEEPKEVPKQSVLSSITSLAKSCENVVVETIRGQNLSNTVQEVWRVVLMVVVTLIVVQMIRTLSSISTATEQQIQLQQQMLLSLQKFDERMNQQAPQNAHVPAVDT